MSSANKQPQRPLSSNSFSEKRKTIDMSNKTFFSNIKAELNSIRTDVNKLVNNNKETPSKWAGLSKTISLNQSAKEAVRQERKNSDSEPTGINPEMGKKFTEQINELTMKFDQQNRINTQLQEEIFAKSQQNQWLKKKLEEIKLENQQKTLTVTKLQRQCERSVQLFNTQNLNKLQHRIQQQQNQIETKKCQLRAINELNSKLQRKNQEAYKKYQQQLNQLQNNYDERISRAQAKSYKELGADFERKINDLIDQNYSLRNKISNLQSQLDHSDFKIKNLEETVTAFQQRDAEMGKSANEAQMENLRNQVMKLQEQNDKMQSDHEFQIMKLENQMDELRENQGKKGKDSHSVTQILKDQITEIENLRQKLREKNQIISKLKK